MLPDSGPSAQDAPAPPPPPPAVDGGASGGGPDATTVESQQSVLPGQTMGQIDTSNYIIQTGDNDDDEEIRTDTLYEATDLKEYIARRAESDDIPVIKSWIRNEDYEFFKFDDPYLLLYVR